MTAIIANSARLYFSFYLSAWNVYLRLNLEALKIIVQSNLVALIYIIGRESLENEQVTRTRGLNQKRG